MDGDSGKGQAVATEVVEDSPLRISLSNAGPTREISILRIDGIVDTMTSTELDRIVSSLITRGRYRLIVDLAGVEYISSAGWGIFISYLREIREHAGDIKLARMTPDVREIYELLEFDGLLPAYDRLDAAEADFCLSSGPAAADTPVANDTLSGRGLQTENTPKIGSDLTKTPSEITIDEAVLNLVAQDPFFTISELRGQLQDRCDGRFRTGWWNVFACLRRHHMLTRRARFRYYRHQQKTAN